MLKITLLGALLSLGLNCTAASTDDVNTSASEPTSQQRPAKRSLAAQLGMTPDEAEFNSTREMRSRYLNDMQLDENREVAPLMPKITPH